MVVVSGCGGCEWMWRVASGSCVWLLGVVSGCGGL